MVRFNGVDYFYVYNLQGDVAALIDADSTRMVEYVYDAWGYLISKTGSLAATIGTLNPFRYRGYVYGEETGLYYLRSRYYNPVWKRFMSADVILEKGSLLLGANALTYCYNSPVQAVDSNGLEAIALTAPYTVTGSAAVGSLIEKVLGSGTISFCALLGTLIFTPAETANDEAEIEYKIEQLTECNTLVDTLGIAKLKAIESTITPKQEFNLHHIVARTSPKAYPAQAILTILNIDRYNDPDNLLSVSTKMHWYIHTDLYYSAVNGIVNFAYGLGGDKEDNVRRTLRFMKLLIQIADQ